MRITASVIAGIQREAGGAVYAEHFWWLFPQQRYNEGYNVLCHPEGAKWSDEVPLTHLENKDVPTSSSGFVILSLDIGAFAVIDPNGQLLGLRRTMEETRAVMMP
jgi:hypothetical protein